MHPCHICIHCWDVLGVWQAIQIRRAALPHALHLLGLQLCRSCVSTHLTDLVQGGLQREGALHPGTEADCRRRHTRVMFEC